ncbi:hypothetical protein [Litorivita pollutaquae]|nr:hypothetical protein [Litorivita pollutaquae]
MKPKADTFHDGFGDHVMEAEEDENALNDGLWFLPAQVDETQMMHLPRHG